ncbi:MAG: ParB/RepB/Spo0J family partition protein [Bauldia sp.]
MAEEGRRGLGRGLAALIGEVESEPVTVDRGKASRRVPIELVSANPHNPRKSFDADELDNLASSIREKGIVQPILVRPAGTQGGYEIIAGERRWRAAQRAGLHDVPVIVHDVSDKEALELAIVENVQRSDLNPMEEASGYQQLIDAFGYTQGDLADVIGKSRSHVANTLRLLKLPDAVQGYVRDGKLSAGHARTLINAPDPETAAKRIVEEGLSVRDAEAAASPAKPRVAATGKLPKDTDTMALERSLFDAIGLAVSVDHNANGSGKVQIWYRDLDQLDGLCRRLKGG